MSIGGSASEHGPVDMDDGRETSEEKKSRLT